MIQFLKRLFRRPLESWPCNHFFVEGFGAMGDAVVCAQCGLDRYPEHVPVALAWAKAQGRYIEAGDEGYELAVEYAREARRRREARNQLTNEGENQDG